MSRRSRRRSSMASASGNVTGSGSGGCSDIGDRAEGICAGTGWATVGGVCAGRGWAGRAASREGGPGGGSPPAANMEGTEDPEEPPLTSPPKPRPSAPQDEEGGRSASGHGGWQQPQPPRPNPQPAGTHNPPHSDIAEQEPPSAEHTFPKLQLHPETAAPPSNAPAAAPPGTSSSAPEAPHRAAPGPPRPARPRPIPAADLDGAAPPFPRGPPAIMKFLGPCPARLSLSRGARRDGSDNRPRRRTHTQRKLHQIDALESWRIPTPVGTFCFAKG